ncbi:MAG: agmatinase [Deltaproteobacteria bacterium]
MSNACEWWMGLNDPDLSIEDTQVAIIGVPYDGSVSLDVGAAEAPGTMRELSILVEPYTDTLIDLRQLRLKDVGDAAVDNSNAEKTQAAVEAAVSGIVKAGVLPVLVGGDHSITSAAVKAFSNYKNLGIIWFDSHPDLMDVYEGYEKSGTSRWNHACPLRRVTELSCIDTRYVLLIGIRDIMDEESRFAQERGIEIITAYVLDSISAGELADRIGRKFKGASGVYLSIDIDVLDPAYAPGTGVPVPGGIATRCILSLLREMLEREKQAFREEQHYIRIIGADIVEVAPPLDIRNMTSLAAISILKGILAFLAVQIGEGRRTEPLSAGSNHLKGG